MGLWNWLFGGNKNAESTQSEKEDRRSKLVERLIDDHRKLVETWVELGRCVDDHEIAAAVAALKAFKERLIPHVMMENTQLYKGLETDCEGDDTALILIRDMHNEMDGIGKVVVEFVKKYSSMATDSTLLATFKTEYNAIQGVLLDRIRREERDLYILYRGI